MFKTLGSNILTYIEFVLIGVWQMQDKPQMSHKKYGIVYDKIIAYSV